jgi:hypothetical protein
MPDEPRLCGCGEPVPRGRRTRWCSSWCEAREAQGLPACPPPGLAPSSRPVAVVPVGGGEVAVPAPVRRGRESLEDQVRRDLERAGVLDSWEAAAALDIAVTIDTGPGSGSARAALVRELRAVMGDALRGTNDLSTSVGRYRDELASRRERRAGGA